MKENLKQISKENIIRMLRYAAAALSVVSFLTTLNGINGIVTDNAWVASLISFGIQAIILVMGLWFIPALKTIWGQKLNAWLRGIVIAFMIVLYICAIIFSSFFSYVYMSVAAYAEVQPIDYNMELELFLVENTRTLRNYNDAVYDVLLKNIRNTAPKFQALIENSHKTANDEIQQIIGRISKYESATIPAEMAFEAEGAINAYEAANQRTVSDQLAEYCRTLEGDINSYITFYETQHYPKYLQCYDALMGQTDTNQAEARKKEIETVISNMKSQIDLLREHTYVIGSVRTYIETKCNGIISQYDFLISALDDLKNAYDEILNHPSVTQGEELTLQHFYEAVYSANISTQEELDKARNDLQQIASAYIQSSDKIDEENVSNIADCIEWLEKLNQCKELRDKVELFEMNNLTKTYIITSGNQANEGTDDISKNPTVIGTEHVEKSTWNTARHVDVTEFISLVKSLPNINQILQQDAREDNSEIIYLRKMEQENYVSRTIKEAYEYSRAKLENISDIERASNYLHSENSFLAIRCCCIAVFLDIASFLIGLYMYTCQATANKDSDIDGTPETGDNQREQPEAQPSDKDHGTDGENASGCTSAENEK